MESTELYFSFIQNKRLITYHSRSGSQPLPITVNLHLTGSHKVATLAVCICLTSDSKGDSIDATDVALLATTRNRVLLGRGWWRLWLRGKIGQLVHLA